MADTETLIRDIVAAHPGTIEVFEQFGIDYCCHGSLSLAEACRRAEVDVNPVLERLAEVAATVPCEEAPRWEQASLRQIIGFIIHHHHEYTRRAIQAIRRGLSEVRAEHESAYPELAAVVSIFNRLSQETLFHLAKEESGLFPRIEQLEMASRGERPAAAAAPGRAGEHSTIRVMMEDHDAAGAMVAELRRLTGGYAPPAKADAAHRRLYRELAEFERDLHRHVHLENNVLFPRALELERKLADQRAASERLPLVG